MGRHSAPPPDHLPLRAASPPEVSPPEPSPRPAPRRSRRERLVLPATAALAVAGVTSWAGLQWLLALVAAVVAGLVVAVAAVLAGTVPSPHGAAAERTADGTESDDAVQ